MVAFLISANTAFDNYDGLLAAVHERLDRDDLAPVFQMFVGLTEAMIQREMVLPDLETEGTIQIIAGVGTLPSGMVMLRRVIVDETILNQTPIPAVDGIGYRIEAGQIHITPVPDPDTTATLLYTARFEPLTRVSQNNPLLDTHPDLYFYGCLAQACDHIEDAAGVAKYTSMFLAVLQQASAYSNARKWGTAPRPRLPEHRV